jgi:hypothetical protein
LTTVPSASKSQISNFAILRVVSIPVSSYTSRSSHWPGASANTPQSVLSSYVTYVTM